MCQVWGLGGHNGPSREGTAEGATHDGGQINGSRQAGGPKEVARGAVRQL
jgi:hypothetical protein